MSVKSTQSQSFEAIGRWLLVGDGLRRAAAAPVNEQICWSGLVFVVVPGKPGLSDSSTNSGLRYLWIEPPVGMTT